MVLAAAISSRSLDPRPSKQAVEQPLNRHSVSQATDIQWHHILLHPRFESKLVKQGHGCLLRNSFPSFPVLSLNYFALQWRHFYVWHENVSTNHFSSFTFVLDRLRQAIFTLWQDKSVLWSAVWCVLNQESAQIHLPSAFAVLYW